MKKTLLIIAGALAGLVAIMWIIGVLLPAGHTATRMARFAQPPEAVWEAITNSAGMTAWRSGLQEVRPLDGGKAGWMEVSDFGELPLEIVEQDPPRRLVMRIADENLPFGGTWTYVVAPRDGGGSTLRITEDGVIHSAFFRFMARFFFGHTATIETYLTDLGKKFGETVTPVE
ncbi:MAG TPA: SRPBCC family protein [Candidatus Acidoferrales bacterium]